MQLTASILYGTRQRAFLHTLCGVCLFMGLLLPNAIAHAKTEVPAGRLNFDFLAGAEFSQKKDQFTQPRSFFQFSGDTFWGPKGLGDSGWCQSKVSKISRFEPCDIHTFIHLTLASIPTMAQEQVSGGPSKTFVDSKKSMISTLGADWRVIALSPVNQYTLSLGPIAKFGFHTLDESLRADELKPVTTFWSAGIKVGERKTPSSANVNPLWASFVEIMWGDSGNFGSKQLIIEGLLRGVGENSYFAGFKAIMGDKSEKSAQDDVRFFVGVAMPMAKLQDLVRALLPSTPTCVENRTEETPTSDINNVPSS